MENITAEETVSMLRSVCPDFLTRLYLTMALSLHLTRLRSLQL